MANKIPRRIILNPGEAVVSTDLNDAQGFLHSYIADGVLGNLAMRSDADVFSVGHGYGISSVGHGGAVYSDEAANFTVKFASGLIGMPSAGVVDGETPSMLWHWVDEADIPGKVRPASVTNPRWDVLSANIASVSGDSETRHFKDGTTGVLSSQTVNKITKTVATYAWTQGVEAASPAEPAIPVGHEKICAVRVEVTPAPFLPTVAGFVRMRDYRVPVGFNRYDSPIGSFTYLADGGATATTSRAFGTNEQVQTLFNTNPSGSVDGKWEFPIRSGAHRLKRIAVRTMVGAVVNHFLQARVVTDASLNWSGGSFAVAGSGPIYHRLEESTPFWMNGFGAGYAAAVHSLFGEPRLAFARHLVLAGESSLVSEGGVYFDVWGV